MIVCEFLLEVRKIWTQIKLFSGQFTSICRAVKMLMMMTELSPTGRRPPPELTMGEDEDRMVLLVFRGTGRLQMFPSQQDEHT